MMAFFVLKIILLWINHFQMNERFDSPLVPEGIIDAHRDYSMFVTGVYVLALLLGLLYILTKKLFWLIAILLVLAFFVPSFTAEYIQDYFVHAEL